MDSSLFFALSILIENQPTNNNFPRLQIQVRDRFSNCVFWLAQRLTAAQPVNASFILW